MTPEKIREAYKNLFETPSGAIVLEDLRARFHARPSVWRRQNGIDPLELAYNEGQRSMYLSIVEMTRPPMTLDEQQQDTTEEN